MITYLLTNYNSELPKKDENGIGILENIELSYNIMLLLQFIATLNQIIIIVIPLNLTLTKKHHNQWYHCLFLPVYFMESQGYDLLFSCLSFLLKVCEF